MAFDIDDDLPDRES
ncbi:unnamed protein product, partial [Rotaria sp. Silwood2]